MGMLCTEQMDQMMLFESENMKTAKTHACKQSIEQMDQMGV